MSSGLEDRRRSDGKFGNGRHQADQATADSRANGLVPSGDLDLESAIAHWSVANDLDHPDAAPLKQALADHATVSDAPLYRGICGIDVSGTPVCDLQPGERFDLQASSTSQDREVAEEFSWDQIGGDEEHDYAVTLELHDARGLDIAEHSVFDWQQEWLLEAGQFEVEEVHEDPDDDMTLRIVARRVGT